MVGGGGGAGVLVGGGAGVSVGGGGGVSAGDGGTGAGVSVGGGAGGVSIGGGASVGGGTSPEPSEADSVPAWGGISTPPSEVGVKVGHGVRVGIEAKPGGSSSTPAPRRSVRPQPKLITAKASVSPKKILIRFHSKIIAAKLSIIMWNVKRMRYVVVIHLS